MFVHVPNLLQIVLPNLLVPFLLLLVPTGPYRTNYLP